MKALKKSAAEAARWQLSVVTSLDEKNVRFFLWVNLQLRYTVKIS